MDLLYYAFAVLVFIASALTIEALWQWWFSSQSKAARKLNQRLQQIGNKRVRASDGTADARNLWKDARLSESAEVEQYLLRLPGIHAFNSFLRQAGADWNVARHLGYSALGGLTGLLVGLLLLPFFWMAVMLALGAASVPTLIVLKKRSDRLLKIERQLPEAADLISRSLRAGHALPSTLQMLGDELPDPIAAEFRQVSDEINFGSTMMEALQRLGQRVPLTDLRYMIVAILIQREAGGNLAEVMTNVSVLIRQRLKLLGDVRTMSAEGRLSAVILCMLPVVIAAVFTLVSPGYLSSFWADPAGPSMLGTAVVLMVLGVLWMRHIVRIRV